MENDEITADLEQHDTNNQDVEETEESEETLESEDDSTTSEETDWKAEALKYKAILDRNKNKPNTKETRKSDDFDYAEKAYLKVNGIDASEFDFVRQEMKNAGKKDIDAILSNPYFKSELESRRELNKTAQSTIKGKRSNGVATDSVEYWMSKPIEEVPTDMRIKVVNAKLQKENSKGVFYNS